MGTYSIVFASYIIIGVIFFKIISSKKISKYKITGIMIAVTEIFLIIICHKKIPVILLGVMAFFCVSFLFELSILERIKLFVISFCIWILIDTLVYILLSMTNLILFNNSIFNVIEVNAITIFLATIVLIGKSMKHNREKVMNYKISKIKSMLVYLILILLGLSFAFTIVLFQYASDYIVNEKIIYIFNILAIISLVGLGLFFIIAMYMIDINRQINETLYQKDMLVNSQEIYYQSLLEREEETRKFRHDIKGHLICIQKLAETQGDNSVLEYLNELNYYIGDIEGGIYNSGNKIVDILLNYYLRMLNEHVNVCVRGIFSSKIEMSQTDICTVVGNALKNAVEELEEVSQDAYIEIKFSEGNQFAQMEMSNSIIHQKHKSEKNSILHDKHFGYGLENIRRTVEKNNGKVEYEVDNEIFKIKVIIDFLTQ